jgi:hypothetical protein
MKTIYGSYSADQQIHLFYGSRMLNSVFTKARHWKLLRDG